MMAGSSPAMTKKEGRGGEDQASAPKRAAAGCRRIDIFSSGGRRRIDISFAIGTGGTRLNRA
jgi:hypothetical protein